VRSGGPRPDIDAKAPKTVAFPNHEALGTVIIDTKERALYYTLSETEAYRYPISVGREGFSWTGTEKISRIADWPDWYPPEEMRERDPKLPVKMTGGLRNPLGVKALYLGNTLYRIHGTNDPKSIGRAASSGCFRMLNANELHLASLVDIGTTVKVVDHWPPDDYDMIAVKAEPEATDGAAEANTTAPEPQTTTPEPAQVKAEADTTADATPTTPSVDQAAATTVSKAGATDNVKLP
jgi:hypothetical protein